MTRSYALDQLGELVQDAANVIEFPCPTASVVGLALAEVFRVEANNLKEQLGAFIAVVISRDDLLARLVLAVRFLAWRECRQAEFRPDDILARQ